MLMGGSALNEPVEHGACPVATANTSFPMPWPNRYLVLQFQLTAIVASAAQFGQVMAISISGDLSSATVTPLADRADVTPRCHCAAQSWPTGRHRLDKTNPGVKRPSGSLLAAGVLHLRPYRSVVNVRYLTPDPV